MAWKFMENRGDVVTLVTEQCSHGVLALVSLNESAAVDPEHLRYYMYPDGE